MSIYRADGVIALTHMPARSFSVTAPSPETLLIDFGNYGGQGLFAAIGLGSAEFGTVTSGGLQPGAEVAQVDWDGVTAHVDWVQTTAIHADEAMPYLELDNFVQRGASGGGVYYNGVHIGNNWTRQTDRLESGEILQQRSIAALNIQAELITLTGY